MKGEDLPVAAAVADKTAGAETNLTHGDTRAVVVVARSLNHVTVTDIDSNVVDAASVRAKEDEITSLEAVDADEVGAAIILGLSVVDEGDASALVDRVLGETAAIEADHIAIITIGVDVLLDTIGGTVVVSTTPAVGVGVDHASGGVGDIITAVSLTSAHSKSNKSKNNKETHFFHTNKKRGINPSKNIFKEKI